MSFQMDFSHGLLFSLLKFLSYHLIGFSLFWLVKFDMACHLIQYMHAKHEPSRNYFIV